MSTPALTIPDYFPTQFGTTWEHLAQQHNSRLRETVTLDTGVVGREKSYNQIGLSTDEEITTRNGETTDMARLDEKRWITLKPYHSVKWFDEWDDALLGNIVKPTSETFQSMNKNYNRRVDSVVITALGATARTGEDGEVNTALPTSQEIAVSVGGAASNLNIEKLIEINSLFGRNEVSGQDGEDDPIIMIVSQRQIDSLLYKSEVRSIDTNAVRALVNGEVNTYMGIRFVRSEQLPKDGSNVRSCYAYVRSGLKLAIGTDFTTMTDILPRQNHTLQLRAKYRLGASRMEEVKVAKIFCDEDDLTN